MLPFQIKNAYIYFIHTIYICIYSLNDQFSQKITQQTVIINYDLEDN